MLPEHEALHKLFVTFIPLSYVVANGNQVSCAQTLTWQASSGVAGSIEHFNCNLAAISPSKKKCNSPPLLELEFDTSIIGSIIPVPLPKISLRYDR